MTDDSLGREMPGRQGFRLVPHGVDRVIEAWGPDRVTCLAEAVGGLVSVFADVGDVATTTVMPIVVEAGSSGDLLVALLEEVVSIVDVFGKVPVRAHLGEPDDGGVAGDLEVVESTDVAVFGPVPKTVSHHDREIFELDGTWRCRVHVTV